MAGERLLAAASGSGNGNDPKQQARTSDDQQSTRKWQNEGYPVSCPSGNSLGSKQGGDDNKKIREEGRRKA